ISAATICWPTWASRENSTIPTSWRRRTASSRRHATTANSPAAAATATSSASSARSGAARNSSPPRPMWAFSPPPPRNGPPACGRGSNRADRWGAAWSSGQPHRNGRDARLPGPKLFLVLEGERDPCSECRDRAVFHRQVHLGDFGDAQVADGLRGGLDGALGGVFPGNLAHPHHVNDAVNAGSVLFLRHQILPRFAAGFLLARSGSRFGVVQMILDRPE